MMMRGRIIIHGLGKAISHARCSKLRKKNQKELIFSRIIIKSEFGKEHTSRKKISDEISKKQVKTGPKISVLRGVKIDRGNPHAMRNGREIKEIKSCNCMLFMRD